MVIVVVIVIMVVVVVVIMLVLVLVIVIVVVVRTASVKVSVIALPVYNDRAVTSVTAVGASMLRVVIATSSNMSGRAVTIEIGLMLRPLHGNRFLALTSESRFIYFLVLLSFLLDSLLSLLLSLLAFVRYGRRVVMREFKKLGLFANGRHSVRDIRARYGGGIDRERVLRNGGKRDKDGENGKASSHENHVEWRIRL
jgi:hypothetical protein